MKSNQPEASARAPRGAAHVDAARASIARRARATTMDPAEPNAGTNAGARVGGRERGGAAAIEVYAEATGDDDEREREDDARGGGTR